jgi:very-short-patch-repair endonuclease
LPDDPHLVLEAVHQRLPPTAAFSGRTAAWLHGLDVQPCNPVEVTVPDGGGISARAQVVLRRAELDGNEVVTLRGLPATAILRTLADAGHRLPLMEAVVIADMALYARLATLDEVRAYLRSRRGRKGVVRFRKVVDLADGAAESAMESRLRVLIVKSGLPRPQSQVSIYDGNGRFLGRVDLYYSEPRVGIEYDGGNHRSNLVADNRRQNDLINAGIHLLRFSAADIFDRPAWVVDQVRVALRR